ncbi:hypothetical protein J2752_001103 [Halarchaeum rubridurum]|uniref:Uncharacterized protein n=1 Tax=Halarchaeum rubridurum TaxID=489911 RepID=A0A830FTD0_9EURY|nr:hypothetical protein [Halarchaeum rubridurum]MBP1954222.1 hypothetical protein [Halarchaeum rubridurum]GGM58282.1 hypothetical protein GCM10009017_05560 [Halarchaeum rubridurum]
MADATANDPADVSGLLARLRDARERRADAEAAVDEYGADTLRRLREHREDALALLRRYEDSATGSGDFQSYIEFEGKVAELVADVDDDLPRADAFDDYDDALDKRRVTESDFERARDTLDPVADLTDRLDERDDARDAYRSLRYDAEDRLDALDDEIDRLERVARLADADLDAPVDDLREPVEAYDTAARTAVEDALAERPTREVLGWLDALAAFPLVDAPTVPPELLDYVRAHDAGDEPVPTLLDYGEESLSKLDHYVEDPAALKRVVGANRSFLQRLDGDFLTLGWPPDPADVLRYRADEYVSALSRLDATGAVERLRDVTALARTDRYERLREAALARAELDDAERERVADGTVADALADARDARERLTDALADG